MSSLFDDLSLPESFRRLSGVRVDPDAPSDDEAPPPPDEAPPPPDEEVPPLDDDELPPPPEDEEPPAPSWRPTHSPQPPRASHDGPPREPAPWASADPAALVALVEGLNPPQREAVEHRGCPLLIVAGAGSGKTRVLTRRIAHLLRSGEAMPGEILAITFTNKAAAEMRERVGELVGPAARSMWVSTFHSACVRILRREHDAAGLKSSFTIYDSADSLRLITTIAKDFQMDTKKSPPRGIASRISSLKNDLIDPIDFADQAETSKNPTDKQLAQVFTAYTERLRQANAVDFDDLIGLTVQLLREHPAIRETYRRRFRHVLVDEYQDTNTAQYALVRELVGEDPRADLTVVGDSDQSIYAFRGATIRNIVEFEQDFPSARTIVLEQNYRSTGNILRAANAVIEENQSRRKKNLWTDQGSGERITLYVADDERGEARYIGRQIDALVDAGRKPSDIAIFYRANAQSRALEDQLIRVGLPYKVVGGTRFYERREIKDAVAYLQVLANPADEINLRRILNVPKRGIGDRAEAMIALFAEQERIGFGEALARADEAPGVATRSLNAIRTFVAMLDDLRALLEDGTGPAELIEQILQRSGYYASLQGSDDPQDESRLENLAELISVAAEFEAQVEQVAAAGSEFEDEEDEDADEERVGEDVPGGILAAADDPDASVLDQFLEKVSLVADADQIPGEESQFVTLMTLHTAKGLEFPVVFLTGLEDRAQMRATWGQPQFFPASRFLDEVPEEVLDVARAGSSLSGIGFEGSGSGGGGGYSGGHGVGRGESRGPSLTGMGVGQGRRNVSRPSLGSGRAARSGADIPSLAVGDKITHDSFGMGTVTEVSGSGENTQVEVAFKAPHGTKRLLLRYAPVTKL
jgi:DNA helicase-2/ATP-dependent DNA helicase PcrA